MRVLLYADAGGEDWCELLVRQGFEVVLLSPAEQLEAADADVCLVINLVAGALPSYRAWIARLTVPTLLITSALGVAQAMQRQIRRMHLICHPSGALGHLHDLLAVTHKIHDGVLVKDRPDADQQLFQYAATCLLRRA